MIQRRERQAPSREEVPRHDSVSTGHRWNLYFPRPFPDPLAKTDQHPEYGRVEMLPLRLADFQRARAFQINDHINKIMNRPIEIPNNPAKESNGVAIIYQSIGCL